jgi:soluble lytic murein transglycosylase
LKLILSFLIILISQNSYSKIAKRSIATDINFQNKELEPTKLDLEVAYSIYELFNTSDLSKIEAVLKKGESNLKSNIRFAPYQSWFRELHSIVTSSNTQDLYKICTSRLKNDVFSNPTYEFSSDLCVKKFLSLFKSDLKTAKDQRYNWSIFSDFSNRIISKKLNSSLIDFLKSLNDKNSKTATEHLLSAYKKDQEIPNQDVLKNIYITHDLSTHIQQMGFNKQRLSKIFSEELDDLGKKITTKLEENNTDFNRLTNDFVNFYKYNSHHLQNKSVKNRMIFTAKELTYAGKHDFAKKILDILLTDKDLEVAHEALFIRLWSYINNENYSQAYAFVKEHNLIDNFANLALKLKYWVAHSVELNHKKGQSIKLYQQLAEQNPLSFYGIIAQKTLTKFNEKESAHFNFLQDDKIKKVEIEDFSNIALHSLIRLKLWDQYNLKEFAKAEITFLTDSDPKILLNSNSKIDPDTIKENTHILMASMYFSNNNFITGFNLITQGLMEKRISHNTYLLSALYPSHYYDQIKKLESDIDPIILMSLIRQESGFNPKARSQVGARGLMQIMPTTAKMLNRRVKVNDLEKPETNLKLGIQYFKYLMKKYDNNLVYSLAAYNAGENRVTKWQRDIFTKNDSILHTIEMIPYQETRDYVKLIFRNMYFYKLLASNQLDHGSYNKIYDIDLGFRR